MSAEGTVEAGDRYSLIGVLSFFGLAGFGVAFAAPAASINARITAPTAPLFITEPNDVIEVLEVIELLPSTQPARIGNPRPSLKLRGGTYNATEPAPIWLHPGSLRTNG